MYRVNAYPYKKKNNFVTNSKKFRHCATSPDLYVECRHVTTQVYEEKIQEGTMDIIWDESLRRTINYEEKIHASAQRFHQRENFKIAKAGRKIQAKNKYKAAQTETETEGSKTSEKKKKVEKIYNTEDLETIPCEEDDQEIHLITYNEKKKKINITYCQDNTLYNQRLQRMGIPANLEDIADQEQDFDTWLRKRQRRIKSVDKEWDGDRWEIIPAVWQRRKTDVFCKIEEKRKDTLVSALF